MTTTALPLGPSPLVLAERLSLHTLDDGHEVEVRELRRADRHAVLEGFDHLSPDSRYRRFLGAISQLDESVLRTLLAADGVDNIALVAVDVDATHHERSGIGIAQSIRDPARPTEAEYAIVVADAWQGRGIGRLLTSELAVAAFRHGIRRWTATMLFDNTAVRRLLQGVSHEIQFVVQGGGVVEARCLLDPLTAPQAPARA